MKLFSKNFLKNIFLLSFSLIFIATIFEIFLRIFMPQIFVVHPPGLYMEDEAVGYVHTPYFEGYLEREEFKNFIKINSDGMRDDEIKSKEPDEFRILILGDSYSFGFGVEASKVYAKVLENKINKNYHKHKNIEVFNGGVSGYGTADQLAFLKLKYEKIKPDLIIVQFLSVNDFEENRYPAAGRIEIKNGMLHGKDIYGDPYDELPSAQKFLIWIKSNLHSGKFLSERAGFLAMQWGLLGNKDDFWGENFTDEDEKITSNIIHNLKKFVEQKGIQILFLYTVGQAQVISDSQPQLKSEKFISDVMSREGIDWINVLREMRKSERVKELYYPLDGHWTVKGHDYLANVIYEKLAHNMVEIKE